MSKIKYDLFNVLSWVLWFIEVHCKDMSLTIQCAENMYTQYGKLFIHFISHMKYFILLQDLLTHTSALTSFIKYIYI